MLTLPRGSWARTSAPRARGAGHIVPMGPHQPGQLSPPTRTDLEPGENEGKVRTCQQSLR